MTTYRAYLDPDAAVQLEQDALLRANGGTVTAEGHGIVTLDQQAFDLIVFPNDPNEDGYLESPAPGDGVAWHIIWFAGDAYPVIAATDDLTELTVTTHALPHMPPAAAVAAARRLASTARTIYAAHADAVVAAFADNLGGWRQWDDVAARLGISTSAVNKAITRHNKRTSSQGPAR